ncbi:MAG: MerR family transcriptional regulator [Pseudonocardiales bacterium]|nr:MerR family transcriptional regulator [Pseudonocardiales bacterium]
MGNYRISQLAKQAGVPATTLRFYEKEGLVPAARTPGGYRSYSEADVERVRFIAAAKHLGLPLDQIRDLLGVWDGGMCREVRDELRPMVAAQVSAAEERIQDLRAFRDRLTAALAHLADLPTRDGPCDPACAFLHDLPDPKPSPALQRQASAPAAAPELRGHTGSASPAIACSLDGDGYADRVAQWRELLGDGVREPLPDGGVTVRLPADRAGRVAELVVAEQQCCPFFAFELTFSGPHVALTAHAPTGAEPIVALLWGTEPAEVTEGRDRC